MNTLRSLRLVARGNWTLAEVALSTAANQQFRSIVFIEVGTGPPFRGEGNAPPQTF